MRKRIQQLARGQFEYAGPILSLSTDKVVIEVLEGRDFTGDFTITSTNHVKMRGIVYSSNPRMECLTPQFEGEEVRIRYEFHSEGLVEGDIQKGDFFIVCNQGEYNLSFVASVSKMYAETSVGKIKNLQDFTHLARESWEEAYKLFYSKYFENLIKEKEIQEHLLYEGLGKGIPSNQNMEEFLIGIHKKKKMNFELQPKDVALFGVVESRKEVIEIKRDQWGYAAIRVSSDSGFLIPDKLHLSNDDFLGSTCQFEYYINEEALHAGNNYGRLTFENAYQKETVTVCVTRNPQEAKRETSLYRQIQEARVKLMRLYLDFRFKKIVTGIWASQSTEVLNHLMALEPENEMHRLMKAQALLINKQKQEAVWILEQFKREYLDHSTAIWGYYLYLCTLAEREESYVDRLTNEIDVIFREHPKDSLLFWILLFLKDGYYNNNSRKLKAIERWMADGNCTPYLYLEAFYFIWQDPYLLHKLDKFEIHLIRWAMKYNMMTKEVALQIKDLVSEKKEFNRELIPILEKCYQAAPTEEMLMVICSYLIKGACYEERFHRWYQAGIEENLRITGLYEAYLMSMDKRGITEIPAIILMYFQYNCNLAYQYKSVLYVNIIAGKEKHPEVYWKYRKVMELFAMEQIELGHMDDNLAVIYEEMIGTGVLNEELAIDLSRIIFIHKLTCFDERAVKVIVYQNQMKNPQIVNLVKGIAYFQLFSTEYTILLEDANGNRYGTSFSYQLEKLMKASAYIRKCIELAPDQLPYVIYHFSDKTVYQQFCTEDKRYFNFLLKNPEVSDSYKTRLGMEIIRFYQNCEYDGLIDEYLEEADYDRITPGARRYMVELLADTRHYEMAFEMMHRYGYDELGAAARISVCSYEITESGYEEDDFLLDLAADTYQKGKFNDIMMIYLSKYYNGSTKWMEKLWCDASNFEIDTFDLEERILTQMLYTADYIEYASEIYDAYASAGGKEFVCMAYLTYFSYQYFVKNMVVPSNIFPQIEMRLKEEKEVNESCRLALLLHYAESEVDEIQYKLLEQLLSEFTEKNMFFAFYKKFDQKINQRYHLYDKVIVEYRSRPGEHIVIHSCKQDEANQFLSEDMNETYEGIYTKEFIVFFGEDIQYYITEESAGKREITESGAISNKDVMNENQSGRYHMLNELILQKTLRNEEKLQKQMLDYQGMNLVTEKVFTLL